MATKQGARSVTESEKLSDAEEKPEAITPEILPETEPDPVTEPAPKPKPKPADTSDEIDSGNVDAEEYLQTRIDELLSSARGTVGRPATLRLYPQRIWPEWARLDCRSVEVIDGEPIDLEEVARQNGGGKYIVRLKKGRSWVPHARVTVSYGGSPITLPGEGPDPWAGERAGVHTVPGPYSHAQPGAGQAPGNGAGEVSATVTNFAEQFKATLEGLGDVVRATQGQYTEIRDEMRRIREAPPVDTMAEVTKSVALVQGLLDVAKVLQPPAAEPIAGAAADLGSFAAGFNQIVGAIPQLVQAYGAISSVTSPPAAAPTVRQIQPKPTAPAPDPSTPPAAGPTVARPVARPKVSPKKPAAGSPAGRKAAEPAKGSKRKR